MPPCCTHCQSVDSVFDRRLANADLKAYRRDGPAHTTRALLDILRGFGVNGLTLLDIGGGVGVIQHELMASGLGAALDVDASSAYLSVARGEAERLGYADRSAYLHGDFVALASQVEPADIVTLDRVVCCYPDMPALVGASAARARRYYGVVFPRDAWWARWGVKLLNRWFWLRREDFRVFVHRSADLDAVAGASGLALHSRRKLGMWQVAVYTRVTAQS